jgi:aspartyl protease family protein
MRQVVIVAVVLMGLGVLAVRFVDQSSRAPSGANAMTAAPAPVQPESNNNSRSVVLTRGKGGHFWAEARVDGRRLEFVVDTGATTIALRESDAARLGIHPTQRDYSVKVSTANGITHAALVQLRMVEVGNIIVRNLPALVHPDNTLGVNLLGMSFLGKVRWTHDRGKLVIEQ